MERLTYWNKELDCWCYNCASGDAAKRLAELENGIEAGTVTELLCKVGDDVYVICNCKDIIMSSDDDYLNGTGALTCPFENQCTLLDCDNPNTVVLNTNCDFITKSKYDNNNNWIFSFEDIRKTFSLSDFGKTIFRLDQLEQAQQALKERSNANNQPPQVFQSRTIKYL